MVRGSATLALRSKVRPLILGLTVVAFGTSAPELFVSAKTALSGHGGISLGNVVGSNIFNIAFILGICALVRPLRAMAKVTQVDGPLLVLVSLLIPVYFLDGNFSRLEGLLLMLAIVVYLWTNMHFTPRECQTCTNQKVWALSLPPRMNSIPLAAGAILMGLLLLGFGTNLLLKGIFAWVGMGGSQTVLGLTVVAAITSIPELVTSLLATIRDDDDLALGNIIGSNIFNSLFIIGATALARPLKETGITWFDMGAMIFFAAALVPFTLGRNVLQRWAGASLLILYAGYLLIRVF